MKKTCGQGVGSNALLLDLFRGMSVGELLELDADSFLRTVTTDDAVLEFLHLKHLFAIQATLEVLTGLKPGGRGHPCALADIDYADGEIVIDAEIDVDIITEQINACSGCKGG